MSWQLADPPPDTIGNRNPVASIIIPRAHDIGDFDVRRALPAQARQMVGPFIFLDQMGPVVFRAGQAMDVRPHPHIGLSTITWLFDGTIQHRDSLGFDVTIRPGEVNWMTAGSGIVHSERSPQAARRSGATLAGIQTWVALPQNKEEMAPEFDHYDEAQIPSMDDKGIHIALIAGSAFGKRSPVKTASETLYAEIRLAKDTRLRIPALAEDQAIYLYSGEIEIAGCVFKAGTLILLQPGAALTARAILNSCAMLLGGDTMDAPRHIYWNFVSSSRERIEQAKDDWRNGRFAPVPGDDEFIPLPGDATPKPGGDEKVSFVP